MLDSRPVPETLPRELPQQTHSWKPTPVCQHYCGTREGDIPCCLDIFPARFGPIGPLIQPTLIENWVTGLFEFGAKNPYLYTLFKTILVFGAFSAVLYLWAVVGEKMGLAEIPRARLVPSVLEAEQRIILEIVDGNWLEELENHLVAGDYPNSANRFLCCLYTHKNTGHKNNKISTDQESKSQENKKYEKNKNREGHDKNKEGPVENKKQEEENTMSTGKKIANMKNENEVSNKNFKMDSDSRNQEEEADKQKINPLKKKNLELLECARIVSSRIQPDLECDSNHVYDISLNLKGLRGKKKKKEKLV